MKTTFNFGLLIVNAIILVWDAINPKNNEFRITSVRDENGEALTISNGRYTEELEDQIENYLEALAPAIVRAKQELRTVRVYHGGSSSAIDTEEATDVVAARIMDDFGWPAEDCIVVEEEAGFVAAVKRYNEAVGKVNEILSQPKEVDYSEEFPSAAEWFAHCSGPEVDLMGATELSNYTPRMQHDDWVDGEIGLTLATMGINL